MNGEFILLVEDDRDDAALLLRALRRSNVMNPVAVACDGAEALEVLLGAGRERQPLPAVVLLDIELPKIDGLEVLRRLRAHPRTRFLPVVILTSSQEQRDRIDGYHLGCNSYVQKPVDFLQLVEAARQLGLYWLLSNERPAQDVPQGGIDG